MENANCLQCGKAHRTDHKRSCTHYHDAKNKRPTVTLAQCGLASNQSRPAEVREYLTQVTNVGQTPTD